MVAAPNINDVIVALCSGYGGGIAVIRISGEGAFAIAEQLTPNINFEQRDSHTVFLGKIVEKEQLVDEVVFTIFHKNKSYTGELTVEIACHSSVYIIQKILQLATKAGARMATEGEFTKRAFLNGRLDLVQAEAVATLIATATASQHKVAIEQMKGGFSKRLNEMRTNLLDFASLLELEIDFSEEDVEFVKREQLLKTLEAIVKHLQYLIDSFKQGNSLKEGINIAIVGKPNVGKSTLFNALIEEDKAIVSDIAGTTRDYIENTIQIEGILFRFIDTAGLRTTEDTIEQIGVERTKQQINNADTILWLTDDGVKDDYHQSILTSIRPAQHMLEVLNKADKHTALPKDYIAIAALNKQGLEKLKEAIVAPYRFTDSADNIVTNVRHYDCLSLTLDELRKVQQGLSNKSLSADMLSWHLRQAIHHIGEITGVIHTEDILGNIFGKFCIGK